MPPPKKPSRLSVPITPEARAALERFSEVSGVSMASFLANVVHDSIPVIEAMTEAYLLARSSPSRAVEIMEDELVRTMAKAARTQLDFNEQAARGVKLGKRHRRD